MLLKKTIKIIVFVLFIEFVFRIGLSILFGSVISTPSKLYLKYYPELKKVKSYHYDSNKTNLLVLGGSVVCNDTIYFQNPDSQVVQTTFCNFNQLLSQAKFNVLSLAVAGHNTLDSRLKYKYLKSSKFDYVFVYHGLNDNRTNNISADQFDVNYRHIEFYDDLYIINQAQNKPFFATLFLPKWVFHQMSKKNKTYIPKEFFYGLLTGHPEENVKEGWEIKSAVSFKDNYRAIEKMAEQKNEKLIIATYAWYIPEDYTFSKFKNKELDYDQQLFPIELYGLPENIEKGLKTHNALLQSFALEYPSVIYFDFYSIIEKNKAFFDDVCHLNDAGCTLLAKHLLEALPHN